MGYLATRIENHPIVLFEMQDPFQPDVDTLACAEHAAALQEELGGMVYRIIDVSKLDVQFSDMMLAMGVEREAKGGAADPNITTCFVGSTELVQLGTSALAQQEQYGKGRVSLFESVDAALGFIQADLAKA